MGNTLRILVVEDSEDDTFLVLRQITKGGYEVNYDRVETAPKMKSALEEKTWDIVLSDYAMPHFNGLEALEILKKTGIDIPFIIISGTIGEDVAVGAMKAGAHDYIMKNNLQRLLPTVERELRESRNRAEQRLLEQEKKQAEDALRESEKRYRRITESLTDYLYSVYVENGRAVKTIQSPACIAVTGYSEDEFSSDPYLWYKMVAPEDRELIRTRLQQILEGKDIPPIEHRIIHKDGTVHWVSDTTILFKDTLGQLQSYDGVIKDITERKRAEIEIARINRALRMLSDTNQALIRINDESTLLNEACRIVIEVGGYRMSWVGFAENNAEKNVVPVVVMGLEEGYIKTMGITWADEPHGQGPVGSAIRTGNICIARDIALDSSFAPWREAAMQCGYRSIIALPLMIEGFSAGALTIYSAETDAFDTKEVEILKELADDLAFGVSTLRIKAKKAQMEEKLKASEELFSAVFHLSPVAIAIFRANDSSIVDANDVFINSSGYSREEILGHSTSELGFYANLADRDRIMQMLQEKGVVESFEFESLNKAGEIRTLISAITYINIKEEKHYLALLLDITERKKSEEQLRLLSTALEAAANAILITDKKANIIWANDAFSKLTGYVPDEIIGHNPAEIINSGLQKKEFFDNLWQTILDGRIWNGEIINRRKDGSNYNEYMTITPVPDKEGNITHFIAVKQDITDRKLSEKALKASEKKYRIVADNTYNWEFWSDEEGKYIYCSPSCLRVTGYTSAEFIENHELKFEIVHPDYRKQFYYHVHQNSKDETPVSLQYKIIRKDGNERWIEHVCQPVFDIEGNYMGHRGSNFDITEKRETEREILNAIINTEESERNKFSQELHDGLGPMLSTVKLYFQWLSETSDVEKQKKITEIGLQNIDDAIQTVREISNNLSPRVLMNMGLVPALKYLFHRINETQKLSVNFTFDEERRYTAQIEVTLYRIISELLNNTIKYAMAGAITVDLAHNWDKKSILFMYSDDGKGFDLNKAIENKKGMGLYNMMQRVGTLDGFINFDTEEGKSLVVRIELPMFNEKRA